MMSTPWRLDYRLSAVTLRRCSPGERFVNRRKEFMKGLGRSSVDLRNAMQVRPDLSGLTR
jgi:hypothetical protein